MEALRDSSVLKLEGMRTRLISTARRLGHSPSDSEDLVQDAFASAIRGIASFREDSSLETWVYRIFLRKHVDRYRRKRRQYDRPPAAMPDPASMVISAERNDAVRNAITTMSPKLQMILILRYIEERSYSEISEMYDVPIGTLRSRMCEALRRLRTLLEGSL